MCNLSAIARVMAEQQLFFSPVFISRNGLQQVERRGSVEVLTTVEDDCLPYVSPWRHSVRLYNLYGLGNPYSLHLYGCTFMGFFKKEKRIHQQMLCVHTHLRVLAKHCNHVSSEMLYQIADYENN